MEFIVANNNNNMRHTYLKSRRDTKHIISLFEENLHPYSIIIIFYDHNISMPMYIMHCKLTYSSYELNDMLLVYNN